MKLIFLACLLGSTLYLYKALNTPKIKPTVMLPSIPTGVWRATLNINTIDSPLLLPFTITVVEKDSAEGALPTFFIHNGKESIKATGVERDPASPYLFTINLPVFNATLTARLNGDTLEGSWNNYAKEDYTLPFRAILGEAARFEPTQTPSSNLAKRWKVTFSPNTTNAYSAVGLFEVDAAGKAAGTFVTKTGDYRYLAGHFDGVQLNLSSFDGAHAFLFKATMDGSGNLQGIFWSGKNWQEPWTATPSEDFELADMQSLTYLKEGYEQLTFSFPDITGDTITYDSTKFKNKVTIVQITASWCPNCMDASRFLCQLYKDYQAKGLEIVALDYELKNDFKLFQANEHRLRRDLGIEYPVLFAGIANKVEASKTLPMLNEIISYPTSVFIDKQGKVRAVHTGFSGPGTGEIYSAYIQKTENFVKELLAE